MKELFAFLKFRKKYWLLPMIIALVAIGALVFFTQTAAMPFVYTLF